MSIESPYGVNAHVAGDAMLAQFRQAGIGWVRIDVDWDVVEPTQGRQEWGQVDRVIATAARLGFSVLAGVSYAPPWATRDGRRTGSPRDPARWRGLVEEFLSNHARGVSAVAFWNEPNLRQFYTGTQEEYFRDIWLPALTLARDIAPGVLRCGPDLSSSRSEGDPLKKWLTPALDKGGTLLDVVTHHQYDGGDTAAGRGREIETVLAHLRQHGVTRPLWITETGWDTNSGVSPEVQAANLRATLREMRKRSSWAKTFWYDSHGPGWGLMEPDASPRRGEPRAAFLAYADETGEGGAAGGPGPKGEDARVVVEHAYLGILGREPDLPGLEAYVHGLEHGLGVAGLCRELFNSGEFHAQRAARPVERLAIDLFLGILERVPIDADREEATRAVRDGRLAELAAAMIDSPEFKERFLERQSPAPA